jgi:hypothetical protein
MKAKFKWIKFENYNQFDEFKAWALLHRGKMLDQVMPTQRMLDMGWKSYPEYGVILFESDINRLKWRCPLQFIREILSKEFSIETKWYHRLFFVD